MTNAQPYREAMALDVALSEIETKAGTHFEPALVDAFLAMLSEHGPDGG